MLREAQYQTGILTQEPKPAAGAHSGVVVRCNPNRVAGRPPAGTTFATTRHNLKSTPRHTKHCASDMSNYKSRRDVMTGISSIHL
ncbi:hypothetical protein VDGL01_08912 [Verticillium dahliae]